MVCLLNKCKCKDKDAFWIDKIMRLKVINNFKVFHFVILSIRLSAGCDIVRVKKLSIWENYC